MSKLLKELYWLNNDRDFFKSNKNAALDKAAAALNECEERLTDELLGENLNTFIKSINAAHEMMANIAVDNFITGMRVGSRLTLELFYDDFSQD